MILLRILILIFIGSLLFLILLYLIRFYDRGRIKRRAGLHAERPDAFRKGPVFAYLFLLILIIILSFMIIKQNIGRSEW
ncbi:Trk-type K+ transport system membrane component [Anaerotaenia torta]